MDAFNVLRSRLEAVPHIPHYRGARSTHTCVLLQPGRPRLALVPCDSHNAGEGQKPRVSETSLLGIYAHRTAGREAVPARHNLWTPSLRL